MINLLKSEFLYFRYLKVAIGPVGGLIAYYLIFVGQERTNAIIAILFFILLMSFYGPWKIEKRVRKLALLPLPKSDVAKMRILVILIPLTILYIFLSLTISIPVDVQTWEKSYAELLFLFGLSLIGASIVFIMNDILSDFKQDEKLILNILISILAVVMIIMISAICVNVFNGNLIAGYIVTGLLVATSLILLYKTMSIFESRSLYLE
ncbi:MAG: hypothetical protein D8M58_04175 [Calditrichaeota bacterium]|nr:MAG: hypothetical protein DWQ03_02900 [Calditrichota bacterium]MBL1204566.1 hypothetical protein [Calditrichota bacterium]NOG44395.1 hypothetical protein [Calditrichota bacterium]